MHLSHELGPGAPAFVDALAEAARRASNLDESRLWNQVASELANLDQREDASERREPFASIWGLMQRIEYYRHRAAELERKAADAPEAFRDGLLEVAEEWRDLALLADLQARLNDEKAKLKAY